MFLIPHHELFNIILPAIPRGLTIGLFPSEFPHWKFVGISFLRRVPHFSISSRRGQGGNPGIWWSSLCTNVQTPHDITLTVWRKTKSGHESVPTGTGHQRGPADSPSAAKWFGIESSRISTLRIRTDGSPFNHLTREIFITSRRLSSRSNKWKSNWKSPSPQTASKFRQSCQTTRARLQSPSWPINRAFIFL